MPLISSPEAYFLITSNYNVNNLHGLLRSFLPIAAENISTNITTINIYEQFVDMFCKHYQEIANQLNIQITNLDDLPNDNYYAALYEYIRVQPIKNDNKEIKAIQNNDDSYQIFISNEYYNIFVSMLSYCIITINIIDECQDLLIKFISMILIASGHIIVLCISENYSQKDLDYIFYSNLFNEIHLFRGSDDEYKLAMFNFEHNSYFYIYVSTYKNDGTEIENANINNETPYIQIFHISQNFKNVFKNISNLFKDSNLFNESKIHPPNNKFQINKILITLYNCQYFESSNNKECWIPKEVIKFKRGFIQANDFIEWNGGKVKFFTSLSETKENSYIDFNEMHHLMIGHHITNPLYLIGLDNSTIELIDSVYENTKYSTDFLNRLKSKRSKTDKYIEEKMLYAFHKIWKHCRSKGEKIRAYETQIYAVISAINYLNKYVNDESNIENDSKNHRGCIFQVKTGEGKSVIINALAEIFARMGKTVHIVTSNIVLACRDYEKSFEYFKECGFNPSILIHRKEFKNIECTYKDYFYPSERPYYSDDYFERKTGMNTKIFKKHHGYPKSNIIFSTFFNFESWYLRYSEEHPMKAEEYFKDCYLIIDESDTILIDEITNGTIIARELKSSGIQILELVFDLHNDNVPEEKILEAINQRWPNNDIQLIDIQSMIRDIGYAFSFEEGSNYIIENEKNSDFEVIVPFDSKQKGITEREKEFNGFIQQFIGFKEKRKNPSRNIKIKPLSLNYKFISHPIYVNQYQGVWGFTGTIGTEEDRKILQKYYKLDTCEIPIHSTNYRKDLPAVICLDKTDRNEKIINEILHFHTKKLPVLVIFDDLTELDKLHSLLKDRIDVNDYSYIKVFNGIKLDKSVLESESGKRRMITLGTNFCGRGADIKYDDEYPLHVIITYGPKNVRALGQAVGRTGRNGKQGTTRIICTKDDYSKISKSPDDESLTKMLREFDFKKKKQNEFFDFFRNDRSWIFNMNEASKNLEKFSRQEKIMLRDGFINVNRITAVKYEYPICMSVDTFQKIQFQKIYSLKNCPECIYTWNLFQRYLRELILETWSIFLDKFTNKFDITITEKMDDDEKFEKYKKSFEQEYDDLIKKMGKFFPEKSAVKMNETFMLIHQLTLVDWEKIIMKYFPKEISSCIRYDMKKEDSSLVSIKLGFYPFELKNKSGARICRIDGNLTASNNLNDSTSNDNNGEKQPKAIKKKKEKINFIQDPELKYLRKDKSHFSITYIIDIIFEKICEVIDRSLSNFCGLHFFIRRGFAGCEFGVCIDPFFDAIKIEEKHCLFDINPLLICTITCKSEKPLFAGILICLLVFIAVISYKISEYIANPAVAIKELLEQIGKKLWDVIKKKCVNVLLSKVFNIDGFKDKMDKIINYLMAQISSMQQKINDNRIEIIMKTVLSLIENKCSNNLNDKIKIDLKIRPEANELLSEKSPISYVVKIGILLLFLIASYLKNFEAHKELKNDSNSYQKEYKEREKNKETKDFDSFNTYKKIKNKYKYDIDLPDIAVKDEKE